MEICKNCSNYDDEHSYPGTGYCILLLDCVKELDSCPDWSEE